MARTQTEETLCRLLSEMDGVGSVDAVVCENENGVVSVVIVCDGANNIMVNQRVREATAAALGTDENNVRIYLKKD